MIKDEEELSGRNILITGATHGLGLDLAYSLLQSGANIAICARSKIEIEKLIQNLNLRKSHAQIIIGFQTNITKVDEVSKMYNETFSKMGQIDTLINNAGIVGPIGKFLDVSPQEWLNNIETNLLGSVIMIRTFLPDMVKNRFGRVIQLSGGGASNPLFGMSAYAASKSAVVRLVENLSIEYCNSGVFFNSVAPGMLKTRLLHEMLEAGPEKIGEALYEKSVEKSESTQDSSEKAIKLIKFLISNSSIGVNGKLISAEWDDWHNWPSQIDKLINSDTYTLRRITKLERSKTWDKNND